MENEPVAIQDIRLSGEPTQITKGQAKVVTALKRMLMENPLEKHIDFLASINVQYSISGNIRNKSKGVRFYARIFIHKKLAKTNNIRLIREYSTSGYNSVKAVFCDTLAKFLIYEDHDYHEYEKQWVVDHTELKDKELE